MLTLTIHQLGDVTVFRCVGRITAEDRDALRIAVVTRPHLRIAVLDLAEVGTVDAAGLGTLVSLQQWAKTNGRKLKLMNLTPRVEEVLELTNLRSTLDVCSVEDMVDLLCRATSQARSAAPDAAFKWASGF